MAAEFNDFDEWLTKTAAGAYVSDWEQRHYDNAVDQIFGYHALHIGIAGIHALRQSRIQHSWRIGLDFQSEAGGNGPATTPSRQPQRNSATTCAPDLFAAPEALPFEADQFDLVVMPHGLEVSHQPHAALREVTRILRPEGRLIISGFNPARMVFNLRPGKSLGPLGRPIGYLRLRDWIHLLNYEVQQASFGCLIPGFQSGKWYKRLGWIDRFAEERLPYLGSTYFVVATKKTYGVQMLEPNWKPLATKSARAATANRSSRVGPTDPRQ